MAPILGVVFAHDLRERSGGQLPGVVGELVRPRRSDKLTRELIRQAGVHRQVHAAT